MQGLHKTQKLSRFWRTQKLSVRASYCLAKANIAVVIPPDMGNAFSNKSIADAYDWLMPLDPPVFATEGAESKSLKDATFAQRAFCSTLLFLMGLGYIVRETKD